MPGSHRSHSASPFDIIVYCVVTVVLCCDCIMIVVCIVVLFCDSCVYSYVVGLTIVLLLLCLSSTPGLG